MANPDEGCEVCMGRDGDPVGTVTFLLDGADVTVLMCRDCMAAVFTAMVNRANDAATAINAEVDALLRLFSGEAGS